VRWLVILHNESDDDFMNFFRVLSQLGLLCSLLMLGACGSGDGADNTTDPTTNPTPTPTTTTTVLSGAYQGTATTTYGTQDFVSAITPDGSFYALYFLSTIPDIYSGTVTRGVNGNATIPTLRMYPNITSPTVVNQTASVAGASSAGYVLTPLTGSSDRTPSSFTATALASTSDLNSGAWTGTWSDSALGTMSTSALTLGSSVTLNISNFFTLCTTIAPTLSIESIASAPLFGATLTIPSNTACARTNTTLTGVAFVYPLTTVPGKTQRLDMVMVDSTGSGITFRGER
jgi:hypothetical protein